MEFIIAFETEKSTPKELSMDNNTTKNPLNPKKIALFVLYGIIALLLFITVLSFNDLPSIFEQLKQVELKYVFVSMSMLLSYMALYPLSLCILTKSRGCDISMPLTYSIAMTEHFFNGITPLATGGQPFQAHSYSRAKIKLADSTGLLLTNLIIYMVVTTGYSLLGIFYFDTFTANVNPVWIPIIIVGYALNFAVLVVMVALGTSKKLRNGLVRFVYWLCKFKIFKWLEPKAEDAKIYFEQVQEAFHDLTKKKGHFLLALLTKICSFAFFYGSSFFILRAMGISADPSQFFMILCATSFALTAVGFIPTPGASGGVEGSASQVFKSVIIFIVGDAIISTVVPTANGVMLIWRLLSYYFVMAVSLIFVIGNEIYFRKSKKYAVNKKKSRE